MVIQAGYDHSLYGNRIIINHNDGYETTYNHLSQIDVHVGETVHQGQTIGIMGETGNATGVHLHFEIYKNKQLVNPLDYISE